MLAAQIVVAGFQISAPAFCLARVDCIPARRRRKASLTEREHHVWTSPVHDSEFAALTHPATLAACGAAQPPQALATPDPLLDETNLNAKRQLHHRD